VLTATEVDCARGRGAGAWQRLGGPGDHAARRHPVPWKAATVATARGTAALAAGAFGDVETELRLGLERAEANIWLVGRCHLGLTDLALHRGATEDARRHAEALAAAASTLDNRRLAALATHRLALLAFDGGDTDQALRLCHEALDAHRAGGYRIDAIAALETIAAVLVHRGSAPDAARLFGACDAARRRLGSVRARPGLARYRAARARLVASMPAGPRRELWLAGGTLSLNEGIDYATRGRGRRSRPAAGWESLTPAELAVVRHVAAGMSNGDIGVRLLISPATVKTHLAHVFAKLGVANRAELAGLAGRWLS
jgi:ATP/maltotriose-dependent transcriptional regulator MalT